jgi:hypothetical protein
MDLQGGEGLLEGVPAAVKTALTKAFKQREGRVRSSDLLPALSLPGFKKVTKKPARMNFMAAEDEEGLESLQDPEAGKFIDLLLCTLCLKYVLAAFCTPHSLLLNLENVI